MLCGVMEAQSINGTISDETGPLPGANILVKGTTIGTQTDFDGVYTLDDVASDAVLVISFIGYKTQEVSVNGQSTVDVTLLEDGMSLDEVVVVSVGYGVQKKALVTGANVNVKGKDIQALNTTSAMGALQGITPGVSVTNNNGSPGSGTTVRIRGAGTIGNADPLYIVDGVAVGNIDYLNGSDIQSIDVLKDAASAAIYGSRAANGVILVTTVKGKKGSPVRVQFDTYTGIQKIYKNLDPLNAQEYMYIMDEGRVNDGLAPNDWHGILQNNAWLNNNYPDDLGTQYGDEIWGQLENGWEGTNWIDEMTNSAPITSYALNITGGSEDISYALGASYLDQDGMIGGDIVDAGFKRLTLRMNTEFVLYKNEEHSILTIGENLTYTNRETRDVRTGNIYWNDLHNALVQNPLMPAYWDKSPDQYGFSPTTDGLANDQTNPIASMFYSRNYNWPKNNTLVGNAYLIIEPIKDLKFRSSFGIDSWFGHNRSWTPTYGLGVLYGNTTDGAQQDMYFGNRFVWSNQVSWQHQYGDHHVDVMVGNEFLKNQINMNVGGNRSNSRFGLPQYAYLNNFDDPETVNEINTWGADYSAGGGGLQSYYSRASYNYKEKYLFTATFRADGSSNFAPDNRWGYFPSVSAGWVMSDEDFMANANAVNFLKLRASWGQNGNQSIDNFIYSSSIAYINPGYYFGDTKPVSGATAVPARVTNPDVTWETSEQLDFGVDARFLSSRLNVAMDWYSKKTKDWLVVAPIQGTSGAGAPWVNGGDVENTGVEFMFSWNDQVNDFKYGITLSGAYNKNEITKIANSDGIIQGPGSVLSQGTAPVSRAEVGFPIGYFYGMKTDGILQNQDEVDAYAVPATDVDGNPNARAGEAYFSDQRPGDVRFVDQNQDGLIDEADKLMLGKPNPDFELGLQLHFEWKGVYLNTTLAGKYGMQVMQSYRSFADRFDQNYTSQIFDRWHGEGTSTRLPRLSSVSNRNINLISDIYMEDADYLRVNNMTVGYNVGRNLEHVEWIGDLKLYIAVNNLYTFTNYSGMDPEVRYGDPNWASGIDLGLYPLPRTWMLGLSVNF